MNSISRPSRKRKNFIIVASFFAGGALALIINHQTQPKTIPSPVSKPSLERVFVNPNGLPAPLSSEHHIILFNQPHCEIHQHLLAVGGRELVYTPTRHFLWQRSCYRGDKYPAMTPKLP